MTPSPPSVAPGMKVEIWSDVVCPWCYVGKRRFEQALAGFAHRDEVEVVWRAFELDSTAPAERTGGYAENLAAKYGTDVPRAQQMVDTMTATAAQDGLELRFDRARPGNTFDAHRLLHLAAERGVQDAVKERLLRATFTEGEPIGDAETLVRLVTEAGLDADEAREVLATDRFAAEVRGDQAQARAYGITGVPFFVVDGRYGVSGAQPAQALEQVLAQAWAERAPLQMARTAAGPGCDGDACAV
ncbi:MAG: 2-hydroxychromene-2-carboxylate isomerase/DsbA-like thioredoxin domain [uncultured Frankineae bacterium]|uniref:2-hydroxychromene-2-carboxylate isomerase/DsbA-like thioredoxin domain n=1 Tax=uncultured Frankineae bacterium TaxID=437475 RepID=A0A6J4LWP6_9ACTN|nr:MAG: 2-hydroxychromene-2-carboxylate isomerase/DsbA-like thioredoxin domain [uncultured Frankineae bacterium]